jgi:transcriptional adapter 2-alpha
MVCTVKDKQLPVYDISHLSGVERLSPEERELCQACRLHPEALLGYVTLLEGEWQRCGRLRLVDARRLLKIDVNKTRKIYNFLTSKGRIQ